MVPRAQLPGDKVCIYLNEIKGHVSSLPDSNPEKEVLLKAVSTLSKYYCSSR